ncbi:hypothetical protein BUALT_Bualt11G0113100 [Buddleja alternifolia]|uniref:PWWP domain-containing protein n=1 Tax=Buddleja alternifolia TaxID=168488 RepID=A0AAV6X4X5_9LAMI|nr:hypothetical protein BUALT_Bualt11G0113100 [Buddleja alternifolia]
MQRGRDTCPPVLSMAEKLNAVNVTFGVSGSAVEESNKGVSGGMVNDLESKTLVENSSERGVLNDGVRVSGEESKVLVGELNKESVISGTGLGAVDRGNVGMNDRFDGGRNRAVEKVSKDNEWKSWGVMNLVGRVLEGNFCMDDEEMEDINNFESGPKVNPVEVDSAGNTNAWQGAVGEPTSGSGINIKGTEIGEDSDMLDSGYLGVGNGLNGNQDLVSNKLVPDGKLEIKEVNNVVADVSIPNETVLPDGKSEIEEANDDNDDVLIPKARGEHDITEKEGEYYVSDLVWGKVKSHPWWPGQIVPPKVATDKAERHFKRGCYLIAYFGDRTFAWNEGSKLKPFRMHFSQMEKQSNADGFCHAVDCAIDEAARRVELGLSCPCLPKEVHDKINIQVVENAGVVEKFSRREGGDNLSTAESFSPSGLVEFLESLSIHPQAKPDRLQLETRNAQLLAFNRWKGHYQLPVFEERGVLLEDGIQLMDGSEGANEFPSRKRKPTARDGSSRKRRHLSGDEVALKMKGKCGSALVSSSGSSLQKNEKKPMKKTGKKTISSGKNHEMANSGEKSSSEATKRIGEKLASDDAGKSQKVENVPAEELTPQVVLSKLKILAINPMEIHEDMIPVINWIRKIRALIFSDKSGTARHEGKLPFSLETTDTYGYKGTEDSYWTDRIIEAENVNLENNNKKKDIVIVDLEAEEPEEHCPTAFILNFTNLESIPSIANLNQIFSRYGPLKESETEILSKSKRAKVIFKRREDADTAFSSTGKFSIFGPSLVSYKLNYAPTPRKKAARGTSKRNKKDASLKINDA